MEALITFIFVLIIGFIGLIIFLLYDLYEPIRRFKKQSEADKIFFEKYYQYDYLTKLGLYETSNIAFPDLLNKNVFYIITSLRVKKIKK